MRQRRRFYLFISLLVFESLWHDGAASGVGGGSSDARPTSGTPRRQGLTRQTPVYRSTSRPQAPERDELPSEESHSISNQSPPAGAYRIPFLPLFTRRNQRRHTLDFQIDSETIASLASSGIKVGLLCWLCSLLWRAVVETVDELNSQINNSEDPLLCSRKDVDEVVAFLQQNPTQLQRNIERDEGVPPKHLLQVANKLALAGLPLTSSSESPQQACIQNVLARITKRQALLLQDCLWAEATSAWGSASGSASPWDRVIGLKDVKDSMASSVSLMLQSQAPAFASLFDDTSTSGILLYGPPGCGKTVLVKALAAAARVPCLVVAPSALLRKYVGETNAQVRSLFGLTQLLAPCILCIDELDGIFRERRDDEHEVSRDLKTEFLQWMDGLLASEKNQSKANRRIIVIGATNRPFDVDTAILRRLPQVHYVGLPDALARAMLLKQLLSNVPNTCLKEEKKEMTEFVLKTEGYTPSDLKELLRTAARLGPLREARPRPLTLQDLTRALQKSPPTPLSQPYRQALATFCALRNEPLPHPLPGAGPFLPPTPGDYSLNAQWESEQGKFYDIGSVHVDHETFEALSGLVDMLESMSDDDDGQPTDREETDSDEEDDDV